MIATFKRNACRAFSCKPTPQRRHLSNAVLIAVGMAALGLFGAIHAGTVRYERRQQQQEHAHACAAEPPTIRAAE